MRKELWDENGVLAWNTTYSMTGKYILRNRKMRTKLIFVYTRRDEIVRVYLHNMKVKRKRILILAISY